MTDLRIIPINTIDANPWQPRKEFRPEELSDLAASIKQHGILQPLVVTEQPNHRFRLIAGERRLRAAKQAGLTTVSAVVRSATDEQQLELALIENIQRQDLNPIERARGYDQLMKRFGLTQEQVGKRLGKSRTAVANALRLLALPEVIQKAVSDGRLTEGHAKVIAGLDSRELQMKFFERIVAGNVSVRDTEQAGRAARKRKVVSSGKSSSDETVEHYRELLESRFGTKVQMHERRGAGSINVQFFSEEELTEIVRKMLGRE